MTESQRTEIRRRLRQLERRANEIAGHGEALEAQALLISQRVEKALGDATDAKVAVDKVKTEIEAVTHAQKSLRAAIGMTLDALDAIAPQPG